MLLNWQNAPTKLAPGASQNFYTMPVPWTAASAGSTGIAALAQGCPSSFSIGDKLTL